MLVGGDVLPVPSLDVVSDRLESREWLPSVEVPGVIDYFGGVGYRFMETVAVLDGVIQRFGLTPTSASCGSFIEGVVF